MVQRQKKPQGRRCYITGCDERVQYVVSLVPIEDVASASDVQWECSLHRTSPQTSHLINLGVGRELRDVVDKRKGPRDGRRCTSCNAPKPRYVSKTDPTDWKCGDCKDDDYYKPEDTCEVTGCYVARHYGYMGQPATRCRTHKLAGMFQTNKIRGLPAGAPIIRHEGELVELLRATAAQTVPAQPSNWMTEAINQFKARFAMPSSMPSLPLVPSTQPTAPTSAMPSSSLRSPSAAASRPLSTSTQGTAHTTTRTYRRGLRAEQEERALLDFYNNPALEPITLRALTASLPTLPSPPPAPQPAVHGRSPWINSFLRRNGLSTRRMGDMDGIVAANIVAGKRKRNKTPIHVAPQPGADEEEGM